MSFCHNHQGSIGSHGYPQETMDGVSTTAHRAVWIKARGPIPGGMMVLHACNNKLCVNLEHLRLGTHAENMNDVAIGKYHPKRKLSPSKVRLVKRALLVGVPQRKIASYVGVAQRTIQNIKHCRCYRHDD